MQITLNEGAMATFIDIHDNEVVNLNVDKGEVRVNGKSVKADSKTHAGRRKPRSSLTRKQEGKRWITCF